ncbi:MAG: SagB/ThcOx family dehydrogenase [candidate division KSB1 bacterium]|nr:SagB/ThcOx family dehydrogenase [candidate division KSB1 bacterium]
MNAKVMLSLAGVLVLLTTTSAQERKTIALNPPDTSRGQPLMKALAHRASVRDFDTTALSLRDLSDLLWAGNGINRPAEGKRTAPSAMNAQDVDIYVATKEGFYLYDPKNNLLHLVVQGDHRKLLAGRQEGVARAPVILLLVSDISRFRAGEEAQRLQWAAIDVGTVAQNVLLFCASEGMACVPRATMDTQRLKEVLGLSATQYPLLNIPVSYKKK